VKVAIGQINPVIGDFSGNAAKILEYVAQAERESADAIVFPEMCVCGYPPMDLLDHICGSEPEDPALDTAALTRGDRSRIGICG
jgi:NAD+ synthase (glutamine-hydrolysing)